MAQGLNFHKRVFRNGSKVVDLKKEKQRALDIRAEEMVLDKLLDNKQRYAQKKAAGKVKYERGAYTKAIEAWKEKKGIPVTDTTICPKCNRLMKADLARKQIKFNREEGVECMACINGFKRKALKFDAPSVPTITLEALILEVRGVPKTETVVDSV